MLQRTPIGAKDGEARVRQLNFAPIVKPRSQGSIQRREIEPAVRQADSNRLKIPCHRSQPPTSDPPFVSGCYAQQRRNQLTTLCPFTCGQHVCSLLEVQRDPQMIHKAVRRQNTFAGLELEAQRSIKFSNSIQNGLARLVLAQDNQEIIQIDRHRQMFNTKLH